MVDRNIVCKTHSVIASGLNRGGQKTTDHYVEVKGEPVLALGAFHHIQV